MQTARKSEHLHHCSYKGGNSISVKTRASSNRHPVRSYLFQVPKVGSLNQIKKSSKFDNTICQLGSMVSVNLKCMFHYYQPPLHGVRWWLCWALHACILMNSPLSRFIGNDKPSTALQGLIIDSTPRTTASFSLLLCALSRHPATRRLSESDAARSKNFSTVSVNPALPPDWATGEDEKLREATCAVAGIPIHDLNHPVSHSWFVRQDLNMAKNWILKVRIVSAATFLLEGHRAVNHSPSSTQYLFYWAHPNKQ